MEYRQKLTGLFNVTLPQLQMVHQGVLQHHLKT
jgi:hypothetical protein